MERVSAALSRLEQSASPPGALTDRMPNPETGMASVESGTVPEQTPGLPLVLVDESYSTVEALAPMYDARLGRYVQNECGSRR